jgi:hypothetical protein
MKFAKRLLMVSGAVMLAGMVGVILTPKAAHAIVATLVQVANDNAHPVPTTATEALNSFDANGFCQFIPSDVGHNDFCFVDPIYTVPSGKIAVVEHASGRCILEAGTGLREARLRIGPNTGLDARPTQFSFLVPGPSVQFLSQNSIVNFGQSTKTYVAAGAGIDFEMFATADQLTSFDSCEVDISGNLVSQ